MKKIIGAIVSISMLMPILALAGNGTDKLGPFAGASQDGSSCGGVWADDTYNLFINVHDNGDGTFAVKTDYKDATFVTLGGASPGSCSTANNHGTTVTAGVKGDFNGWVKETVTSAVYNPNACDVPGTCTTRSAALAALFPGNSQSDFSWNFEYNSKDKTLKHRHWQDNSDNTGADRFVGDIAN